VKENAIKVKDLEIKFVIHIVWARLSNISKTSRRKISNIVLNKYKDKR
jgi:hypothetical protein